MSERKHCDDYINDPTAPEALRKFLAVARAPAHGAFEKAKGNNPKLFAAYKGKRVRVTMASRFGDLGVTTNLSQENGYEERGLSVEDLTDFSAER